MKKSTFILKLLITAILLVPSIKAFAGRTQVKIEQYTEGEGAPTIRTDPVICFADKEAGYVEVSFRRNFGVVSIEVINSIGNVVSNVTIDTSVDRFATLNINDPDESYTIEIEGGNYRGNGVIH
jgi:hypothetical protein